MTRQERQKRESILREFALPLAREWQSEGVPLWEITERLHFDKFTAPDGSELMESHVRRLLQKWPM